MAITKLNSLAIPDNTIVEADLSYPLTNFSSTGIDDNASSTAVTIDSSQRVGIGVAPDSDVKAHIENGTGPILRLSLTGDSRNADIKYSGGVMALGGQTASASNTELDAYTDGALRLRVDASGHVKIVTSNDTAGTYTRLLFGTTAFNRAEIRCTNAATYDGSLEFHTGNSSNYLERMRLNPIGRLGLGTTPSTPETLLDIKADATIQGSGIGAINVRPHYGGGKFFNALRCAPSSTASDVLGAGLHIGAIDKDNALITSGNFYNSAGYYYNSHTTASAIALGGGQVVFYGNTGLTAGTYTYLPTTLAAFDGDGLKFNGDTATANALDDYEEGTWTPAITGTAGIPSVTYSHRSAYYIKTGNSVIARWGMRIGSISGGSGTIRITGLPYTGKNYGSYQQSACFSNSQGLTTDADGPVLFYVEDGQSTMQGRLMTNSDTVLPLSYFQAGSWCIGTIIYDVA